MNRNDIHIKIKEIGDHPVALKHTFGGAGFGASFAKKT
jgi:hypothetical protein